MSEREYLRFAKAYALNGNVKQRDRYLRLAAEARAAAERAAANAAANRPPIRLVLQPDGSYAPAPPGPLER